MSVGIHLFCQHAGLLRLKFTYVVNGLSARSCSPDSLVLTITNLACFGKEILVTLQLFIICSLALTADGTAHCFGRREYGRLGLGELEKDVVSPTPITSLEGQKVTGVSAGECISLVVTESGKWLDILFLNLSIITFPV